MTNDPHTHARVQPRPAPSPRRQRRFRWTIRIAAALLLLVLSALALRLWAGHRMQSRWDALIAEIQQTGDPILFEDMAFPSLDPEDNKPVHLRRALADWPRVNRGTQLVTETD